MAKELKVPDFAERWVRRLDETPYGTDPEMPAAYLIELSAQIVSMEALQVQARRVLTQMQRVLAYWTPERIELEAYRRAADNSGPTLLAREASVFTLYVNEVMGSLVELSGAVHAATDQRKAKQIADGCRLLLPTLEILDRRASQAEHRATDLRLRYEFDKLRAEVAGQRLASAVGAAIIRASQAPEDRGHIAEVLEGMKRLESKMDRIGVEVDYVADIVMEQFIRPKLAPTPERAVQALLKASPAFVGRAIVLAVATKLGVGDGR